MITRRTAAAALAAGLFTTVIGYAIEGTSGATAVLGPGLLTVEVDIEHSRFSVDRLAVRTGTLVRFLVRNHDPIVHELVVGDRDVHARHVEGSELAHPPVPGEVSMLPGETGVTFYEFDEPGTFAFVCHLPRHAEYGMVGEVTVTD